MDRIYTFDELKKIITPIADKYGIENVWLFGSYARGEATENSDVDLYVKYRSGMGLKFLGFVAELEEHISVPVDVITDGGLYNPTTLNKNKQLISSIERERRAIVG